jgi:regulatory protein
MKVTKIEYQKKDPSRVNLYIDDAFFCGISLNTLAKEALYEGMEVSSELLDRIALMDLRERFLNRATEYILRSPKSEFQMYRYLRNVQYKKQGVWFSKELNINWDIFFEEIVGKLKEYKYIDDENFARVFVQSRVRNKPRGKKVLISELISKGINRDTAQRICDEEIVDEMKLISDTFEKKYKGKKFDINDQKMIGFLMRKGFTWDLIREFDNNESSK